MFGIEEKMKKCLYILLISCFSLTTISCSEKDESTDTTIKSFNELITGTFKWKTVNMSETISSSTTDYPYTVTHIVTDNYSYFGHTISNNGDNYSRTIFGKVVLSYDGRDDITLDCDGHQKSYKKVSETLQFVSLVKSGCTTQNFSLENTTTSTDIFSVKSDSIITQTVLHDNGTILRIYTNDWERQ
jgi:hypothetical protein